MFLLLTKMTNHVSYNFKISYNFFCTRFARFAHDFALFCFMEGMEVCQIVLHCHYIIFGEMSYVLQFWQTADIVLQNVKKVLQCPSMYYCTIRFSKSCRHHVEPLKHFGTASGSCCCSLITVLHIENQINQGLMLIVHCPYYFLFRWWSNPTSTQNQPLCSILSWLWLLVHILRLGRFSIHKFFNVTRWFTSTISSTQMIRLEIS